VRPTTGQDDPRSIDIDLGAIPHIFLTRMFIRLGLERHVGGSVHHPSHLRRFRSAESALKGGAAALAGLAIMPLPASAVIAGLRILGLEAGCRLFPTLSSRSRGTGAGRRGSQEAEAKPTLRRPCSAPRAMSPSQRPQ
jgi:hypothetical protein